MKISKTIFIIFIVNGMIIGELIHVTYPKLFKGLVIAAAVVLIELGVYWLLKKKWGIRLK
jgi:hypothetical protein